MIETSVAQDLVERLSRIEARLARLLESGWRQARTEAVALRQDADALAEAGLTQVVARVTAVAEANSAAEALSAIALATSACRLLRLRVQADAVPDGWGPLASPKRRPGTETLLPVSRLLLDGREVWACVQTARNRCVLVEPPFPAEEAPAEAPEPARQGGIFGRLSRRIGLSSDEQATPPPSHWLHRRLRGTLVWRARYPLGAEADIACCTIERPEWVDEQDEQAMPGAFRQRLVEGKLEDGTPLFWQAGGLRAMTLDRADAASYAWLDQSGPTLLANAYDTRVWAVVWTDGGAAAPLAFLVPGSASRPPRMMHLVPGTPSDILETQA
jgi:hypothetical protein